MVCCGAHRITECSRVRARAVRIVARITFVFLWVEAIQSLQPRYALAAHHLPSFTRRGCLTSRARSAFDSPGALVRTRGAVRATCRHAGVGDARRQHSRGAMLRLHITNTLHAQHSIRSSSSGGGGGGGSRQTHSHCCLPPPPPHTHKPTPRAKHKRAKNTRPRNKKKKQNGQTERRASSC